MKENNIDIVLVKIETILNLLTLLENSFVMNQNLQGESVTKVLRILIGDLENELLRIGG